MVWAFFISSKLKVMAEEQEKKVVQEGDILGQIINASEPVETTDQEEEPTEEKEEGSKEEEVENVLLSLDGDEKEAKIKELLESEELDDEEVEFLKENGHEVQFEGEEAKQELEEEKEEEKEEEPEPEEEFVKPAYAEMIEDVFPGRSFTNDKEYSEAVAEHLKNEQKANQNLIDVFEDNPELQSTVKAMIGGKSFIEALHENFDVESLSPSKDDENYKDVVRAQVERERQKEEMKRLQEEFESNKKKSTDISMSFVKSKKLDQSASSQYFNKIDQMIADLNRGVVSEEFLDTMYKGINFDRELKEAKAQAEKEAKTAEIKGKNAAITTFRKKTKGDGVPKVASSKTAVNSSKNKKYDSPVDELIGNILNPSN